MTKLFLRESSPSRQQLSTNEGQNQRDEEQNEKEEDKEEEKENEQNEQESQHEEQAEQEENEQVEQNENDLVEHHENENIQLNENELVEQNDNLGINQNDQQYNELLYSGNENLNVDMNQNQNENIDFNNINFGEYTQEGNLEEQKDIIHDEQNYSYVNKALIQESTNKVVVQENVLPLKYLPEKINKVIVDNNIGTLPLIVGRKSITYETGTSDTNNAFGISQVSQYNPTSLSYQIPNTTNYQYGI